MYWFGEPWPAPDYPAPVCSEHDQRVEVPVGEVCTMCGEQIMPADRGVMMGHVENDQDGKPYARLGAIHAECWIRAAVGCSCPTPGASYRDEARIVFKRMTDLAMTQRESAVPIATLRAILDRPGGSDAAG